MRTTYSMRTLQSRKGEGNMLAAVGGLSIVGILVVVLIIMAIVWFARRA